MNIFYNYLLELIVIFPFSVKQKHMNSHGIPISQRSVSALLSTNEFLSLCFGSMAHLGTSFCLVNHQKYESEGLGEKTWSELLDGIEMKYINQCVNLCCWGGRDQMSHYISIKQGRFMIMTLSITAHIN